MWAYFLHKNQKSGHMFLIYSKITWNGRFENKNKFKN